MKMDAHCIVAPEYDRVLTEECGENQLMVPRRYSLHEETWTRDDSKPYWDYHYLSFPEASDQTYGYAIQVQGWNKRTIFEVDDTMTYQGSGWVANRKYFMEIGRASCRERV